jgi:hypothetical protein
MSLIIKKKQIIKLDKSVFQVNTIGVPQSAIILDFNPLIKEVLKVKEYANFCLIHWQAKPFGNRTFGVFDYNSDDYFSSPNIEGWGKNIFSVQVNENFIKSIPVAMLCLPEAIAYQEEVFDEKNQDRWIGNRIYIK